MLPDGWKSTTLGKMNLDISDGNYSSKYPCASDFVKVGIPFLRANNIQSGTVNDEDMRYISIQKHDELQKGHLKKEDILITTRGDIGQISITPERHINSNINAQIVRINSNNLQNNLYLFHYLSFCKINNKFEPLTTGTALKQLPVGRLKLLPILIPPLPEQKKIAAILSTWDRAIEETEKLLTNSQQQKKALMQQLLTGKKRLPGFTGEWKKTNIENIAKEISIRNKKRTNYPVISCTKTKGFVDSLSFFNKKVYSDDLSGYKIISRNQIGFPSNHVEEGSIGLQNLHDDAIVSPIYTVFSMKENVDPLFVFAVLKTDHYRQIFAAATNSSVDRRGSLRWSAFSQIKINLPSLSEQQAIAAALSTADEEIAAIEADLSRLRQEKKALMQQLLTGKRRVTVD
ncbi:restriction endonuclease subunit S [Acetobacter orientalis]|uniref:restriction endonuclease subunit S n=1 Tax=Acetobacter orientalis TaxID=146474 RepID=UPI0020A0E500|nr:restriction endonuclease subunit S [Acetobacter orientalis]MCP1216887.1 restriction endonuclease subunit S [Acetobacter orientalis]MCP1219766.1 restriction endonuclease subunit S [Acetobacter orientalis]